MNASCTIDTSNLMKAQAVLDQFSKTIPSQALNRTVLFIVGAAQKNTPRVSPGRVDVELAVEMMPHIGKKGQIVKTRKYSVRPGIGAGRGPHAGVPLSFLIIGARANPGSNYNTKNSGRYAISGGHPLKGVPRSQFRKVMEARITRMVRARHSMGGFFMQAWGAITRKLVPHVPGKYMAGFGRVGAKTNPGLGSVSPAMPGAYACSCTIELNIGMDGTYPALAESRNQAMHRLLGPVLQSAVDQEFLSKLALAEKNGWLDAKPALAACGFAVNV